ncbi:hypothetical protein [Streptomyces sp. ME18-1-4]|uniref:hypothetical protein n=1 Tax=Streptomyces sp. ME18-1-4 TaxID=3028685 RepID=UPI0029AC9487|nr:hypothetical protein [Streptomyces sp. ME18-1-4]MDX3243488.1 hypothetical protein [Streptomyces sp. ME18-1-4]
MSAPETHDPLVVNTQDGSCWTRRAVNRAGRGLYALADAKGPVPELVLATLSELAEHGLSSMSMHALPMPAGSVPLRDAEDELTGANLSLWEEEQTTARLRLALKSAKRGRRELRADAGFAEGSRQRWRTAAIEAERERDALRVEVAALREERHSTNESLDDAVQELQRRRDRIAELEALKPAAIQTCGKCGAGYSFGEPCSTCAFKARMAVETAPREVSRPSAEWVAETFSPKPAPRDDDPNGLHHTYRVGRDLPELGGQR